jgi:hypothetical protein
MVFTPRRDSAGRIAAGVPVMLRMDAMTDFGGPVCLLKAPDGRELGNCWIFLGSGSGGYGYIRDGKKKRSCHRVAWEFEHGEPAPDGKHLDHVCRRRACRRPLHLDLVTPAVNVQRSPVHDSAKKARRDCCPQGHLFDEANTYRYGNTRQCRACNNARNRARYISRPRTPRAVCGRGHPLDDENTERRGDGRRRCYRCIQEGRQRRASRAGSA